MNESEDVDGASPYWAVFGDLMTGLLGAFVLILLWVLATQIQLTQTLARETERRQQAEQRQAALEEVLAGPLAAGRITLIDGRIGISGSVLFALNSADLQPAGKTLLDSLAAPLHRYLEERNEWLMVSGFTDDLPIQKGNPRFEDNWDLSAQRALTVTRALIEAGMPATHVFAAAFGEHQPVASNQTSEGRASNRRVEMSPVPRNAGGARE